MIKKYLIKSLNMFPDEIKKYFTSQDIKISIMKSDFWGGNIVMGDLMIVNDFILQIKNTINEEQFYPSLIIIPSSFLSSGIDLVGDSCKKIERKIKIPIHFMKCRILF